MNFQVILSDELKKKLTNLKRKDKTTYTAVKKKIIQITSSDKSTIQHFKNLRHPMNELKRVHIGSFVLIFGLKDNTIIFEEFEHHDKVYKKSYKQKL